MESVTSAAHLLDVLPASLLPLFEEAQKPLAPEGLSEKEVAEYRAMLPHGVRAARALAAILPMVAGFGADKSGELDAGLAALAQGWLHARGAPRFQVIMALPGGREFVHATDDLVKVALKLRRELPLVLELTPYPSDPAHVQRLVQAELAELDRRIADLRAAELDTEDTADLERLEQHRQRIYVKVAGG
jgi:hypothetical protein